jgi:hypothetical protein
MKTLASLFVAFWLGAGAAWAQGMPTLLGGYTFNGPSKQPIMVEVDMSGDKLADLAAVVYKPDGSIHGVALYLKQKGRKANNGWLVKSLSRAILPGIISLSVKNKVLVVAVTGQDKNKTQTTYRYRWQNGEMELIGRTQTYQTDYHYREDFNLSTGIISLVRTDLCLQPPCKTYTRKARLVLKPRPTLSSEVYDWDVINGEPILK